MQMEVVNRVQLKWRLVAALAVLLWFAGLVSLAVDDYNLFQHYSSASEEASLLPSDSSSDAAGSIEPYGSKTATSKHSNSKHSNTKHSNSKLYLMGRPKPVPEKVIETENLTETRLDFELRGVFASEGSLLGGAVIDVGDREPGFFQIGDLIAEDITLVSVQADGVVIDRAGMREKLSFDKSLLDIDTFVRTRNGDFSSAQVQEDDLAASPKVEKVEKRRLSLTERLKILRSN